MIIDRPDEKWLPIKGYEGVYEVSSFGRVKSISRVIMRANGKSQPVPEKIRKTPSLNGYPRLNLHNTVGIPKLFYVHHLVAYAFIGPRPEGKVVAHNDGNAGNPSAYNLRYATQPENDADKVLHGTNPKGTKNCRAKLNDAKIRKIRLMSVRGIPHKKISERFGVHVCSVYRIVKRTAWNHI